MDAQNIAQWLNVLDDLTYYAILNVAPDASYDTLKFAFHNFAEAFHPDAHAARSLREREGLSLIFKRANEAYRVLSDPSLRARYDQLLGSGESQANASKRSLLPTAARDSTAPKRLEDAIRSPTARPFARRAEELVRSGDLKQAKLQLTLARHHDPDNDALEAYIRAIEARAKPPAK